MPATAASMDFTNVKERSEWNKKRQVEGEYRGKVTDVADVKASGDGVAMWVFTIEVGRGSYPYYCKHQENQFWKVRNLLIAAGLSVPKKKVKVDPNKVVGREIGVSLIDAEYEGRAQSDVEAVMPLSELDEDGTPDEDEDADTDDVDDDEDEAPAPKKKKAPQPADDDDEDDEEVEAEDEDDADVLAGMDRTQLKQHIAKSKLDVVVKKSMSDDDIRDAIRAADTAADDDDDLEEIDIDDA